MNVEFTLYAVDTGSADGLTMERTYLSVPGHNFNCFGRNAGGRLVRSSTGSAAWAYAVYGHQNEGLGDAGAPTGITIRYNGVCQNSANRILALVTDDIDARGTGGNVLAILMYGKYGFGVDQYVASLKSAGATLLSNGSGEIRQSDIDTAVSRIATGQTPDAELDILHVDIPEQENIAPLPPITDAQRAIFGPIYTDYQSERAAVFAQIAKTVQPTDQIALRELPCGLVAPLEKCVESLVAALGLDQFKSMFGVDPAVLKGKFAGFL
jgi:hypothetical protein